ncbi:hypothetical protein [Nostoc sp. CMAA1605]|uniref:hypothetical protein n=1 Tax=Nostoc sp. CMAA1605 TaxID=2055159 RepID=UPI001F29184A|nr:hypothetical protein [Nostoc sp. CMAA1605]
MGIGDWGHFDKLSASLGTGDWKVDKVDKVEFISLSLLSTHYSALITQHSSLITHYSSLRQDLTKTS